MSIALTPLAGERRFGEILVDMGAVSPESVESALELQQEKGGRIGEILLDMEAISADDVAKALADWGNVTIIDQTAEVDSGTLFALASTDEADIRPMLFQMAVDQGWQLTELHRDQANLEDVFRRLTTA